MRSRAFVEVECDQPDCEEFETIDCAEVGPGVFDQGDITTRLEARGWVRAHGDDYCPAHAPKVKQESE